jgi:signal transduction histidine kinase
MTAKRIIGLILFCGLFLHTSAQDPYTIKKLEKTKLTYDVNIISDLCIDTHHKLYIATPNRIITYNGYQYKEIEVPQTQRILTLVQTYQNDLLVVSTNGSVFKINTNLQQTEPFLPKKNLKGSNNFENYSFLNGPKGFIEKLNKTSYKFSYFQTHAVYVPNKHSYFVRWFHDSNLFWLDTTLNKTIATKKTINRYYYHNQTLIKAENTLLSDCQHPEITFQLPPIIKNHSDYNLIQKPHQPLYLTWQGHIWKLVLHQNQYHWQLITQKFNPQLPITCITYDSLIDHYYVGTQTEGLFLLKAKKFKNLEIHNEYSLGNYYVQLPIDINTYITNNGKIAEIHPQYSQKNNPLKKHGINNNLFKLNSDEYLGHTNEEFIQFNIRNNRSTVLKTDLSLGGTNYFSWSPDTIFIASKDSLYFYHKNHKTFTTIGANKWSHLNIYRIKKIRGLLWLASCSGIDIYDPNNRKFIYKILPDYCIRELHETDSGVLISCYGRGLALINPKNFKITFIPLDRRKGLKYCHAIIPVDTDVFILPTNHGILEIRKIDVLSSANQHSLIKQPKYFDEFNGIPTNEFNGGNDPSYIFWGDTLLSIPSLKGIIQINPKNYNIQTYHPLFDFKISKITRNNKLLNHFDHRVHTPTFTDDIRLQVEFNYWGNPSNLPLYYKYLNKEYPVPFDSINNIVIPLQHFNYENITFYCQSDSSAIPIGYVTVYRNPLWYTQFHLWLVIIISIWGLFFLYDKARMIRAEIKTENLEHIIALKTQELYSINNTLEKKLQELTAANQNNELYVSVINHDIYAPIKYINLMGQEILNHPTQYTKNDIKEHLNSIINSTKRLEILCSNILNHLIPNEHWKLEKEHFLLNALMDELQDFIKLGLKFQNNTFVCKIPKTASIYGFKDALQIILVNLLSNSNRFTQNGTIQLSYHFNSFTQEHEVMVSDTGKGIPEELKSQINSKKIRISNKNNNSSNSYGIGYNLIFKMLELLDGRLEIDHAHPKGVVVLLYFPK